MSFRFSHRWFLTAGLMLLAAIFVTVSTANFVSGAEPEAPAEKEYSALHPKRMYRGLQKRFSGLFGKKEAEEQEIDAAAKFAADYDENSHIEDSTPSQEAASGVVRIHDTEEDIVPRNDGSISSLELARRKQKILQTENLREREFVLPQRGAARVKRVAAKRPAIVQNKKVQQEDQLDVDALLAKYMAKDENEKTSTNENPFADVNFDQIPNEPVKKMTRAPVQRTRQPVRQPSVKRQTVQRQPVKIQPVSQTRRPAAPAQPARTAPIVKHMLGYCPVYLKSAKFVKGEERFRTVYRGRTYFFASQAALEEFERNPEPYAPVLQGIDVVDLRHTGRHREGYLSYSCDYDGRFYMFRTVENQDRFLANPTHYAVPR